MANPARKWWALVAIAASVLVVGLDLTVLNLALPTVAADLHASTSDLQWVSGLLQPGAGGRDAAGRDARRPTGAQEGAADRAGLVRTQLGGVRVRGEPGELIAARAVLGIGAAAIFPLSLSVIPVLFAPEERQKAIALMASATFLSFPIGPIVGGYAARPLLVGFGVPDQRAGRWRWPLIAVAFLMPESRSVQRLRVDIARRDPVQRRAGRR